MDVNGVIKAVDDVVWGWPLMILILLTGLYLTIRLGLLQVRRLPTAL